MIKLTPRHSTENQRDAVKFCENILKTKFTGRISDFDSVSTFLQKNLPKAIKKCEVARERRENRQKNFYERYGDIITRRKTRRG